MGRRWRHRFYGQSGVGNRTSSRAVIAPLFALLLALVLLCSSIGCGAEPSQGTEPASPTTQDTGVSSEEQPARDTAQAVTAGHYAVGHPEEASVAEFLRRSKVVVLLSGHNGITMESADGEGWDNQLSLDALRNRVEDAAEKTQATILLENNFAGDSNEDDDVVELLKQVGFETIVVQSSHSNATVIDRIVRGSK
ncbi:MAG: hypothetical protein AAFU85_26855 [Planctomycetota bacterium]